MPVLLDTNVLIDALDPALPDAVRLRIEDAVADCARYSVVTRIELLGWRSHTEDSRHATEGLLAQLVEIHLSSPVVGETIRIRSSVSIKLPDAIIAASALVAGLPLMTRNVEDFRHVEGLALIDPFA